MDLATSAPTAATHGGIDIGAAFAATRADPDWLKKSLIMGAVAVFLPVIGILVALGWTRQIFERVQQGDSSLPDLDFGAQLKLGIAPLLSVLNAAIVMIPLVLLMQGAALVIFVGGGALTGIDETLGMIAMVVGGLVVMALWLVAMVVGLMINLITPELMRRGHHGENFPLFSPRASIAAVRGNVKTYVMTVVGLFVANLLSGAGVLACYLGMFLTIPMAMVMSANLLAQWDMVVKRGS